MSETERERERLEGCPWRYLLPSFMIFLAFLIFFKFAKITSFRFIPDSHFLYQPSTMSKSVMAKYVKERVVLSALLSRYTKLVPTSEKSYLTNCFYHEDKTPSMMVNDVPASSPYYYCFSCGESGDFIKFLTQKATNVSSTTILQSSYYALSAGKTVEEYVFLAQFVWIFYRK